MNLHSKGHSKEIVRRVIFNQFHSKEIVWRVIFNQSSFERNSTEGHI